MTSFSPRRKARIIQSLDDEDADAGPMVLGADESKKDGPLKFGRTKLSKSSSLRKSLKAIDLSSGHGANGADDEDADGPVVVRPVLGRSGSARPKRQLDDAGTLKKTGTSLSKRALENRAARRPSSDRTLPLRFGGGDDDRPRYSREYLAELQSTTPSTPQDLRVADLDHQDDVMQLDESELDGALVVPSQAVGPAPMTTRILGEAEIRERKERRARLAAEADMIPLDSDHGSDDDDTGFVRAQARDVPLTAKQRGSRLAADDEDLGEGYDEFVGDGRLALGRRAEREAARQRRRDMEDMIRAAEAEEDAHDDEDDAAGSDDSEAGPRAAYEKAQRRAGMDGLPRVGDDEDDEAADAAAAIPRLKDLPRLSDVVGRLREAVGGLEAQVAAKRARIRELQQERAEVEARERDVQRVLDEAGQTYAGAMAAGLPMLPGERGLETFGAGRS